MGKLIAQSNLPDKNNAIARVVDDVFLMQAAVNTNLRIEKRTEIATSLRDIQTSLSTISLLLQDLRARAATGQALTQEDVLRLDQLDAIVSKVGTTVTEYDQYLNAEEKQIKKTANLFTNIIVAAMVATLIALFLIVFFNILSPINALTRSAQEITQGNYAHATNLKSKDELGKLGNAFDTMTSRLREFIGTLETRVAERTRNLELAAEVGRSVLQVRDLNVMLREAVEIIRSRFNLYYAQVYLANPTQTTLTLRSGTGTVGAELTARGHSLPINSASINGRAAVEKRPVVISDTAASPSFHPNALLPDTRSEMAVPLINHDRVVGVLDMQSDRAGALNQEILPAFEALAGQLAVAVQNANLLEEAEQARAEV
ncbi:MAG: GAF domain-containing protein, partial [Anaerolineales bacterium]|nr:GAF domain-containing protein [Anaerolineales bacterium]